jgi:cell division protein FtsI (penicillin-binding protein 3)
MMLRSRRLLLTFAVLLFAGLICLAGRVTWISLATHDVAAQRMQRQSTRSESLPARRGSLFDRHGRMLATSLESLRAEVLPRNVLSRKQDPRERAALVGSISAFLAPLVNAPRHDLERRLRGKRWTTLGQPVTDPVALDEMESMGRDLLYGIDLAPGWTRRYPWGRTAGNLVGYVNHEGLGVAGLEQGLDDLLQGHEGARSFRVDHLGREVVDWGSERLEPIDGLDVSLTLDARIQQMVETEALLALESLDALRVTVVAIEPQTGDVLAMCSVPGIDLSDVSDRSKNGSLCAAVQEIYQPGSTFKPLMMATGLQLGLVHPGEPPIDCRAFDGRLIHDSHPKQEPLTLEEIIVHSSNIGMANILTRIVPADDRRNTGLMAPVHGMLLKLGFGRRTGVPLPAEVAGRVTPLDEWKRNYTLASVAFGQELGVSALQMAAAASTLSDGLYRPPRLVQACTAAGGEQAERAACDPVRVFSPEIADLVRGFMQASVEHGACEEVRLPGVNVAGKTGTAEDESKKGAEVHSYVALAPAEDPLVSLVVVVREPSGVRYASESAAPTAGRILRRLLPYMGLAIEE